MADENRAMSRNPTKGNHMTKKERNFLEESVLVGHYVHASPGPIINVGSRCTASEISIEPVYYGKKTYNLSFAAQTSAPALATPALVPGVTATTSLLKSGNQLPEEISLTSDLPYNNLSRLHDDYHCRGRCLKNTAADSSCHHEISLPGNWTAHLVLRIHGMKSWSLLDQIGVFSPHRECLSDCYESRAYVHSHNRGHRPYASFVVLETWKFDVLWTR